MRRAGRRVWKARCPGKGMEAMASTRPYTSDNAYASARSLRRAAQLWQFPLLLVSIGLFGYAAYLFIDPKPGPPSYEMHRRLAESFEALRNPAAALKHYRAAMALDPNHSLRMQRKVIDLQLDQDDAAGAAASLEEYTGRKELTDTERAWALCE